jgi:RNA polymerase sigma-70 factor (ECF subfamily)
MDRRTNPGQVPLAAAGDMVALLDRARGGSPSAIGKLFESTRAHLVFLASRQLPVALRPKVGPSDIVQETAVEVHRDFARFDGSTAEEFFAWVRSILHNNVLDAVRRYTTAQKRSLTKEESLSVVVDREGVRVLPGFIRAPEASAIRREDASAVVAVLGRLSADHQTVLRLRYWDDLTFPQIGERLGRSEEAVRKLWLRALRQLQAELRHGALTANGCSAESVDAARCDPGPG